MFAIAGCFGMSVHIGVEGAEHWLRDRIFVAAKRCVCAFHMARGYRIFIAAKARRS